VNTGKPAAECSGSNPENALPEGIQLSAPQTSKDGSEHV